jgi:integrase
MEQLLAKWLASQQKRLPRPGRQGSLSIKSFDIYLREVKRILPIVKGMAVSRFGQRELEQLRDRLADQGYADRTVRLDLSIVRMAWGLGSSMGWAPNRPLPKIELPEPKARRNVRCPSQADAQAVFDQLSQRDPRLRLAYLMIWFTGARVTEAVDVHWSELDLAAGRLTLRRKGKKGQKRVATVDVHPVLLCEFRALAAGTPDRTGLLISSVSSSATQQALRREMKRACARAKVERFTPHGLRRLAATILIEANTSQKVYETLMGHSWEMGMKIYAEARRGAQQSAVALLGPMSDQEREDKVSEVEELRRRLATLEAELGPPAEDATNVIKFPR